MATSHTLAQRFGKLGTETAYAVSGEAQAHRDAGNKVFAFHIGDLNFSTPPCIVAAAKKALDDGKTGYCPALGIKPLRDALAKFLGEERGVEFTADNIAVQPGGKPVIGKWIQALMNPGDHVMGPAPGYPIYESVVDYFDGVYDPYFYKEQEDGSFALDMDSFRTRLTDKTRFLIYNNYQNPTGAVSSREEMEEVAKFAVEHDLHVLSDEAYFHLVYDEAPVSIVSFPGMKERTVVLFTCSKSWAMTGWRCGCAAGPEWIIKAIGKLSTNDEACTSHPVQWAALAAVTDPSAMEAFRETQAVLRRRRDLLHRLLNEVPGVSAGLPLSTFYIVANVTEAMKATNCDTYEDFRQKLLKETGVSFTTREHFGSVFDEEGDQRYVRFAYSGIEEAEIEEAMCVLKAYLTSV